MKVALTKQFGGECETANKCVRVEACESAVASLHQSTVTVVRVACSFSTN